MNKGEWRLRKEIDRGGFGEHVLPPGLLFQIGIMLKKRTMEKPIRKYRSAAAAMKLYLSARSKAHKRGYTK
jgi:hypothetical protein